MTSVPLIDFHCHVDLYPDPPAIISECDERRVRTLAVTTTPRAWPQNKQWTSSSIHVRPALGLHPQLVGERADELTLFEKYLPEARYVGEVGLDAGPRFYASFEKQLHVFRRVLDLCAAQGGKILSVHSVRATSKVLQLLAEHMSPDRGRVVLHWFSGTTAEAKKAADLGCYFSVNGAMLVGKRPELVLALPRDRLLTETDGPFTAAGDRPLRPPDVLNTTLLLAKALGESAEATAERLQSNLRALLSTEGGSKE